MVIYRCIFLQQIIGGNDMTFSKHFIIFTAVLLFTFTACEQPMAPQTDDAAALATSGTTKLAKKGNDRICSCTVVCVPDSVAILWGDKNIAVGTISVTRDEVNLYVTYSTINGWKLDETHLDISAEHFCERGAPGKYLYKKDHENGPTTYTYTVPITWVEGTTVYFRAHAEVKKNSKEVSAYAGTITNPKRGAWFGQFCYTIKPTTPPPPPTYTVSGIVYFDADNNGMYDSGEQGITNVTIELSDGQITVSDANGNYSFSGLLPDTYTVIGSSIDGLSPTSTLTKKFSISSTNYSANFGYTILAP
jgi:hypothetical protein